MNSVQLTTNDLLAVHISGGGIEWGPGLAVGKNKTALLYPVVVSVDDQPITTDDFQLYQNYSNPFNPSTKTRFTIPPTPFSFGERLWVRLIVYDILGNEIATLVNEEKPAGEYEVTFDSHSDSSGIRELPSGIYFYQLRAGSLMQTKKMILLK